MERAKERDRVVWLCPNLYRPTPARAKFVLRRKSLLACFEPEALKHRDIRGKPDGERWQKDVPGNHPSPLQARQQHGIEGHRAKILAACEEHVP